FYSSVDFRDLHSFPTRRSSDLAAVARRKVLDGHAAVVRLANRRVVLEHHLPLSTPPRQDGAPQKDGKLRPAHAMPVSEGVDVAEDRKSTRLNSSHVKISYAVFC